MFQGLREGLCVTIPVMQQPLCLMPPLLPSGPVLVVFADTRDNDRLAQAVSVQGWAVSAHIWPQGSAWRAVISQEMSVRWSAGPSRPRPCPPGPPRKVLRPACPLNASPLDPAAGTDVTTPHQKPPALPLPALRSPQRGFQGNAPPTTGWLPNKANAGLSPSSAPRDPRCRPSLSLHL